MHWPMWRHLESAPRSTPHRPIWFEVAELGRKELSGHPSFLGFQCAGPLAIPQSAVFQLSQPPPLKMKISVLTSALTFAVANAVDCDLTAFKSLLTDSNVTQCTEESGFVFVPPAPATETQLPLICTSSACQAVVAAVEAISPTECTLVGVELYAELLDPIISFCGGGSSSGDDTAVGSGEAGSTEITTSSTGSAEAEAGSESFTSGSGSTAAAGSTASGAVSVSMASGIALLAAAAAALL